MIFIYGIVSIIIQKNMLCKNKIRAIYFCLNYNHHCIIIAKIIFSLEVRREISVINREMVKTVKNTQRRVTAPVHYQMMFLVTVSINQDKLEYCLSV